MGILEELKNRILIADGAMGTLLYSYGVDRCFEELNLSKPEEVKRIHSAYIDAGARVIQTNTYSANSLKLARFGLEDEVKEINKQGIEHAKLAASEAKEKVYVLGTIGGIRSFQKNKFTLDEIKKSLEEQVKIFIEEDVDGILFETFYDQDEIKTILKMVRNETNIPIITNVSIHEKGVFQNGTPLTDGFEELIDLGTNVIGLNCRFGPYHMLQSLEEVPIPEKAFLSAYPNESLPSLENGRITYGGDEQYFYDAALQFRNQGVRLLGGCCGTTPKHIRQMADAVSKLQPVTEKIVKQSQNTITVTTPKNTEKSIPEICKKRRSVIVEFDPPRNLQLDPFYKGVKALSKTKIDAITLADNSLASPRVCNTAMAQTIKNEYNVRPLVHLTCRDRNLIGLQSHLMGLHTLGLHDLLAITGDPSKLGEFPGATSVYDVSSMELISLIKQFNNGLSYSGKSLGEKTNFTVAAAFNPNVRNLNTVVKRLERKIEHGADYFITQPVYTEELMIEIYEATKHLNVPIYLGIMPLTSSRNAEFLHNEVPGIKIADNIREKMRNAGDDKVKGKQEGIAVAKSLIDAAYDLFNGIYLITPFLNYEMSVELTEYIYAKEEERKITNV